MSTEFLMPSNHLILCCLLLLLPSIFPSIRVFSNELALYIRWPKYWRASASASVLPMNIQSWFLLGLIGLILLSKGFSRVFSSTTIEKASVLRHSAFFTVQLSHPYMTTGKTVCVCVCVCLFAQLCLTLCDPLDYTVHGILQARIQEWKKRNILFLLQGIFPTQGLSPGLLHCRWILYQLSHKGLVLALNLCWQSNVSVFFFFQN